MSWRESAVHPRADHARIQDRSLRMTGAFPATAHSAVSLSVALPPPLLLACMGVVRKH